jgi:hypothetical protein
MKVSDDLDDGIEFGERPFDDPGHPQAISHAASETDRDNATPVANRHRDRSG